MTPENHYYGHKRILSQYVDPELGRSPRPIIGYVQHGWNPGNFFWNGRILNGPLRLYVWSKANEREALLAGLKGVTPIGAPFLYHPVIRRPPINERNNYGSIIYPFHPWEESSVFGSHLEMASALKAAGHGSGTVCLYWLDYKEESIRKAYLDSGFRVICHGHRDNDPEFLDRQIEELRSHRTVVSNRVCTAIWYGVMLGLSVDICGPVFGFGLDADGSQFDNFQRKRWPALFSGGAPKDLLQRLSHEELGTENIRAPEELQILFGWRGYRRAIGHGVSFVARIARLARSFR